MAEKFDRRLAAILVADIAGYSTLVGADEEGTLLALKGHQGAILPLIAAHDGRVIDLAGDGILAEFPSALGAVEAALAVQETMRLRNLEVPPASRMQFRIGVNQGDVIYDASRIYGEGINVASRIQALAAPGGICVSGKVFDEIRDRVDHPFTDIGERELKNIARPVRVYALGEGVPAPRAHIDLAGFPLPSVAVLPFDNLSGDPEQEYFADGVVEDILTALSRFKSFSVVARNSSFVYKGKAVDIRQVARELGVRYVLEGSVRRSGSRLRITAQLIDGITGGHLWADRFDGAVEDVFDVQDRITEHVAGVVEPQIRDAEIERSRRERPGSLRAYDLYLQALPRFRIGRVAENAESYHLLLKAIAIEPDNGPFLCEAARALERVIVLGWPPITADDRAACIEVSRRGLANARDDASVLATCSIALMSATRDPNLGMGTLRRALELNPNHFRVLMSVGLGNLHYGDLEEALACMERALRLSPGSPSAYVVLSGIAHVLLVLGRFDEALAWAGRSLALSSDYHPTYWMLIAANAHLGRMDEARAWAAKFHALAPDMTVALIRSGQPHNDRGNVIFDGLARAGFPAG